MEQVRVGEIELCADERGDRTAEPMLLMHGLGSQLIGWDDAFCALLGAHGFHAIRFDNRDAGRSTILDEGARYNLDDMADDATGLLDALGVGSAHLVGVSMGAMIAQTMAVRHPTKVRSLASIMGSTGAPGIGAASPEALEVLVRAPAKGRQGFIDQEVVNHRIIGSRGALVDEDWRRARYAQFYDRGLQPRGTGRNLRAIAASGDRSAAVGTITVPTVVIHGDADTLVDVSGGWATAAAIAGSQLVIIEDLGHELPPGVWDEVVTAIVCNARRAGNEKGAR